MALTTTYVSGAVAATDPVINVNAFTNPSTAGISYKVWGRFATGEYVLITSNNSTALSLVSSVAAQRVKVYAYSITSTMEAINDVSFYSSAANLLWPIALRAISSGVTGANLAVSPPGWLFATEVAAALNFNVTGTTGTYKVAISYFQEA